MFTLRQDAPSENRALGCDSNVCSNVSEKKVTEGVGGKKRGGQWEKCFSPDDAVKLKSFDLCPKPYLHRLLSLLKALPSSCSETVGVFSLLPQPRGKVQYPFVAAAAPPVRTNAALPYLFILKEAAPVRDHYLYEQARGFPALTSCHVAALQGMLFWWPDRGLARTHTRTHTPYCSRLAPRSS